MSLLLRRIRVYGKLGGMILLALAILLVVFMNRNNTARVWFFGMGGEVSTLWLIVVTALVSVATFWIGTKVVRTVRQLRALRQEARLKAAAEEQARLAKKLEEQERRIDEKLQDAITKDS